MGLEILFFHREEKYEFPDAAFRYEGQFKYVEHRGLRPAHFHLCRVQS
jgi:hypothetical protein